jgi:exoribonuclease II
MSPSPSSSPLSSSSASSLTLGTLVMFEHNGSPVLGVITGLKKDQYSVFTERGREDHMPLGRLFVIPSSVKLPESSRERQEQLSQVKSAALALEIPLRDIWEVCLLEPRVYSTLEIVELGTYPHSSSLAERCVAVRCALLQDALFFKRVKDSFTPRTSEIVEELSKAHEIQQEQKKLYRSFIELCLDGAVSEDSNASSTFSSLLTILIRFVAGSNDIEARETKVIELFLEELSQFERARAFLKGSQQERLFLFLTEARVISPFRNLSLARHNVPTLFSPGVDEAALAIKPHTTLELHSLDDIDSYPVDQPGRIYCYSSVIDLTSLHTVTIDDESTKDIDDAVSFEQTSLGFTLGIHITHVTDAIEKDSPLDREGMRRATSVYCPDCTIAMLPRSLSESTLSLVKGAQRPCLSLLLVCTKNGEILRKIFTQSLIEVKERLSYASADALLEQGDERLEAMNSVVSTHHVERIQQGALHLEKTEAVPKARDDGSVVLQVIEEESPARALIAELMVIYNTSIAQAAHDRDLPLPFRHQDRPERSIDDFLNRFPEGPARDFAQRSQLKRSETSLLPKAHYSLGVPVYTQATSPIRRYLDLIVQRQFISFLSTRARTYDADAMQKVLFAVEEPLSRALTASRESKRFWFLRYLQLRMETNEMIEGVLVRNDDKIQLAYLNEVLTTFPVRVKRSRALGDIVNFKIVSVDPWKDFLRFEEAH